VGEVYDPPSIAGSYVPDSVDMTFDFGLASGIRLALQNGRAAPLSTALGDTIAAWPPNQGASFLSNHDQARIMSQLNGDLPSAKLAAFTLLTGPGVPFIYYGEEIGMTGRKPDERIRTPMLWSVDGPAAGFSTVEPWEPLSGDLVGVEVASELGNPDSLLTTYQDLIRVRSQQAALREGATTVVQSDAEPVIGWLRTTAGETLLSVVNVSDQPVAAYGLALDGGPLCGPVTARLLGTTGGDPGATPASPTVTVEGGLDGYVPLPVLAPRSGYLIALEPAP
jgi:alpha-amylase